MEKRWADMQAKFEQILQQSLAGIPQGAIANKWGANMATPGMARQVP